MNQDEAMTFQQDQQLAATTALYPGREESAPAMYPALGLAGEAGEVCEHFKKALRDDDGVFDDRRRQALKKELGDVLWYVAALCDELDLSMDDVAAQNVAKLQDRMARGVVSGDGDTR